MFVTTATRSLTHTVNRIRPALNVVYDAHTMQRRCVEDLCPLAALPNHGIYHPHAIMLATVCSFCSCQLTFHYRHSSAMIDTSFNGLFEEVSAVMYASDGTHHSRKLILLKS